MLSAAYTLLLLCGPLAAVAAVWVANRIGVPYPVFLVGIGALFYLAPWIGTPDVTPTIVFYVFLSPLVYYAALFIAPDDLRANGWTIATLAVGLVVVTAVAVAGVLVGVAGAAGRSPGGGSGSGADRSGLGDLCIQETGCAGTTFGDRRGRGPHQRRHRSGALRGRRGAAVAGRCTPAISR